VTSSDLPLRLSRDRIWLYAAIAAIFSSLPYIVMPSRFTEMATKHDFANYWSAGATAGTKALTDPTAHAQWQSVHHIAIQPFVYPPAFAWAYAPFAHLAPLPALYAAQGAMAGLFVLAALLIARVYRLRAWFALAAVFAWGPTIATIEDGQNTGLSLVLALSAILSLLHRRTLLAGLVVGLLLYKPTDALALVVLLIVRKEWRALAVAGCCAIVWYAASAVASGGDWQWPVQYAATIQKWYVAHSAGAQYGVYAFTLPTILLTLGTSQAIAFSAAGALFLLALPLLARAPLLEAASMALFVALATSIHAWNYTAALALPAICYVMITLREPWRTRLLLPAYAGAAIGSATPYGGPFLALICIGGTIGWMIARYGAWAPALTFARKPPM
jgi:Glycosyltransferase family 87